jgi:hypothetical protein
VYFRIEAIVGTPGGQWAARQRYVEAVDLTQLLNGLANRLDNEIRTTTYAMKIRVLTQEEYEAETGR